MEEYLYRDAVVGHFLRLTELTFEDLLEELGSVASLKEIPLRRTRQDVAGSALLLFCGCVRWLVSPRVLSLAIVCTVVLRQPASMASRWTRSGRCRNG